LRLSKSVGKAGVAEFPEVEVVDGDTSDAVASHLTSYFFGRERQVFFRRERQVGKLESGHAVTSMIS
jgi:hypothetical protein